MPKMMRESHDNNQKQHFSVCSSPSLPVSFPVQGKNIILYYFILETEIPDDEYYDEDDHNEVVQYLLDVVDEEAQNLLNRNNAISEAQSLLHIKKATSEDHLTGTESLEKQITGNQASCKYGAQ